MNTWPPFFSLLCVPLALLAEVPQDRLAKLAKDRKFLRRLGDAADELRDYLSKSADNKVAREAMTLDDWRWNAEQFNKMGERVNAAGIKFGYHNHTAEFRAANGRGC